MKEKFSLAAARRIALGAQGFADPLPSAVPDRRHLARVLNRIALFQIDSVSAVVRAHYMPLFSRLGPYPMSLLDHAMAPGKRRLLFEYWAHEASLLPVETWPLMKWRMERAANHDEMYTGLARWADSRKGFIDEILAEVKARGPIAASAIDGHKGSGGWWGWSDAKAAFEWLFWAGFITTHSRRGFERVYDLPERVLPEKIINTKAPSTEESHRELLKISAHALGVATATDLRDYFRLSPGDMKGRLEELTESGDLVPVAVEGWKQQAYLHKDARVPRKIEARALLAPFDPVVWERDRAERLFGFRYRIEIYTPAAKRQFGYYVLPFLLGERLVARVDVRADRGAGVLKALGAFSEDCAPAETAAELLAALRSLADWLELPRIEIAGAGDLIGGLAALAAER